MDSTTLADAPARFVGIPVAGKQGVTEENARRLTEVLAGPGTRR